MSSRAVRKRKTAPDAAAEQPIDPPVRKTFWRDDDGNTRMAEYASVCLIVGIPCPVCTASWEHVPLISDIDFTRKRFACSSQGRTYHPTPTRISRTAEGGRVVRILNGAGVEIERLTTTVIMRRQAS